MKKLILILLILLAPVLGWQADCADDGALIAKTTSFPLFPDWGKRLGPEIIVDPHNQDFRDGVDVGEWILFTDGTPLSTLAYEGTKPGTSAVKCAKLTYDDDGGATQLRAYLPTVNAPIVANTIIIVSADFYPEAANTLSQVTLGCGALDDDVGETTPTLTKGVWTTVTVRVVLGADVTGNILLGFEGSPTNGDILYFDNVSVKRY